MKKWYFALIALALLLGTWGIWHYKFSSSAPDTASLNETATVRSGSIESIVTAQGTLEPKDYVDVGAQVSGEIVKLHVEIGDRIAIGDPIANIDPDVYEAQVKSSEAQIKILDAQQTKQQALVKQAEWKYSRNKKLANQKAVSKETLEDAGVNLEVAQAELKQLEAQIEQAKSTLDENKTNLSYTNIFAPIEGTVVDQLVQEGQTINANQTTPTIVQIANLDIMTAKAEVAEADVMKLKSGMPVYFTTLGSGDRRWEGKVRQILPTPETVNDVVLYNVLVDVANEDHSLLPGMTTQMFFILAKENNVPLIPASALGPRVKESDTDKGEAFKVKVVTKSGTQERTVIVSLSDRTKAAIIEGLEIGETVLSSYLDKSQASSETARRMRMRL